jgi:hypothetical protein
MIKLKQLEFKILSPFAKEFAMRTFVFVTAILLAFFCIGCGTASETANRADWSGITEAYPDSVYWKAFGESMSDDRKFAINNAAFNARAAIVRVVGSTVVRNGERFTTSELVDPRTVRQEVKKIGDGFYRAKVLVVAPKSLNPRQ